MPPASDRPEVVLHVGAGKTGTTSIQGFLATHRAALGERGVLYPRSPGRTRHLKLGLSFRDDEDFAGLPAWQELAAQAPARFRRRFHRRLLEEVAQTAPRQVVFSDEALYSLPVPALERLRAFLDDHFGSVHVIVYLRRQDEHLASFYQQKVKYGETRRLEDFAVDPDYPYDYARRLDEIRSALAPDAMTVRRFERDRFVGGVLELDFLQAAAIDGNDLERQGSRNERLDAAAVEFFRLYNRYQAEHGDGVVDVAHRRDLVRRVRARPTGAPFVLPARVREEFMARWERSNAAVAADWFGESVLFASPGPSPEAPAPESPVVTDAELDDLMTVAGLSDPVRAGMRGILGTSAG